VPIKKKHKKRNRIIFWLFVILAIFLTYYVPSRTGDVQYIEREIGI